MPVQSVSQFDPTQFFRLPATGATEPQRLHTQVSGVSVSNDLSGRLSVTTAEGDTITFTADIEAQFRSVDYRSHAESNGESVDVRATAAELSFRKEFGMTVDGDLNEQEVRDLSKLFRKVTNIFKKYFSGQDEEALAKTEKLAERFGRFSSLSGLDLSVDVERSVTVIAAQLATASGAPAASATTPDTGTTHSATPGAAPSTAAAIPPPSSGTTAPTQPSTSEPSAATAGHAHVTVPAVADQTRSSLVDQILAAVHDAKVETRKIQKYLPRLLDNIQEDLRRELKGNGQIEAKQTAEVPASIAAAAFFSYQSLTQTSLTLSIHT